MNKHRLRLLMNNLGYLLHMHDQMQIKISNRNDWSTVLCQDVSFDRRIEYCDKWCKNTKSNKGTQALHVVSHVSQTGNRIEVKPCAINDTYLINNHYENTYKHVKHIVEQNKALWKRIKYYIFPLPVHWKTVWKILQNFGWELMTNNLEIMYLPLISRSLEITREGYMISIFVVMIFHESLSKICPVVFPVGQ